MTVSPFWEFLLDSRYGWAQVCQERLDEMPQAVFHKGYFVAHKLDKGLIPRRRDLRLYTSRDRSGDEPAHLAARGGTVIATGLATDLVTRWIRCRTAPPMTSSCWLR